MNAYEKYAELRDKQNLTDYKVSKKTGIATSSLSEWKNGKVFPKVDKLKKIADCLGTTIDYFVS